MRTVTDAQARELQSVEWELARIMRTRLGKNGAATRDDATEIRYAELHRRRAQLLQVDNQGYMGVRRRRHLIGVR